MSWSSFSLALNMGFINQVFLYMWLWVVVLFLTSLAAKMLEWWSWDTFECSVGSKAEASFTITALKIKHTMFLWTCFPPTGCSAPPLSHAAHLLLHLSSQNRKIAAGSVSAQAGLLLLPCSRGHPPAAGHPTLLIRAHFLAASDTGLRDHKQKMAAQLFFFLF